jgi:hypothetical protein
MCYVTIRLLEANVNASGRQRERGPLAARPGAVL